MWDLRKKANEQTDKRERQRQTVSRNRPLTIENRLMVTKREGGGGMGEIGDGD